MKLVTLDWETYWDSKEYTLSKMTTEAYIRDPRFRVHGFGLKVGDGPSVWVTHDRVEYAIRRINWSDIGLIGQNTMFDAGILALRYGVYPKMYFDTLGMSRAIVGPHSARHGLAYTAPLLVNLHKMDDLIRSDKLRVLPPDIEQAIARYCVSPPVWNEQKQRWEAGDTELTYAVFKRLAPLLPKEEFFAIDWTIRCFTQPRIRLDKAMLERYVEQVQQAKRDAIDSIQLSEADPTWDQEAARVAKRAVLMSNAKYAAMLEALGVVPPVKINAKGKVTFAFAKTDDEHKRLLEHDDPRVSALVAARMEVKSTIEETRALRFIEAADRGPFPIPYNYAGAQTTQRFSGADKLNMQNLPRSRYDEKGNYIEGTGILRRSLCAPPGYVFGVADLSQIEARIVLWFGSQSSKSIGKEVEALETLRAGGDLYSWFGSLIYGRPINKKDNPTERQIAKAAVLGLGYGMGAGRFQDFCGISGIKIDAVMADEIVQVYRNTFAGVRAVWYGLDRAMKMATLGEEPPKLPVVSIERDPLFGAWGFRRPCGLMIKYPSLRMEGEEMVYDSGNTPTRLFGGKLLENISQALAGDFIRSHIRQIHPRYPVVMSTHDEIGFMVPAGEERNAEALAIRVMTADIPYMPGLPMAIEVGFHQRYGEVK